MLQKKMSNRTRRIKPELPGGFRDYAPDAARAKQRILDTARETFERFGFEPIETSSVQRTEVITGGEEDAGKIIFGVKGSEEEEDSKNSLRFDLTVPLARFIAQNPKIPKPFKRYEIGRVWRGERQQAGRYREFTQADVDIVGSDSPMTDAEILTVISNTFKNLSIERFTIKISSRKILNVLPVYAGFPKEKLNTALFILDKREKIGVESMKDKLAETFNRDIVQKIETFCQFNRGENELVDEGFEEVIEILEGAKRFGVREATMQVDLSLVRGLSYYTGTIFEAILTDAPEIGSVFGGGRYDNLVEKFTGQKIPAVGASLGVDRLLAAMEKLNMLKKGSATPTVLILNLDPELNQEYTSMAVELRAAGISTSLYMGEDRMFQAQLAYAVKKEIPYVIIYGEDEKKKGVVAVKNLSTREQKDVPREKIVEDLKKEIKS